MQCDNYRFNGSLVTRTLLDTNLASRWEGVRLSRASGKSPDFAGSFPATSPEVLSLWNLTAIQRLPGNFLTFRKFPRLPRKFPGSQPLFLGSLTLSSKEHSSEFGRSKSVDYCAVTCIGQISFCRNSIRGNTIRGNKTGNS